MSKVSSKALASKSINIRVTDEQKELLDNLAVEHDLTLKDFILNGTIYSKEQELQQEVLTLKEELEDLEEVKQKEAHLLNTIERLEEVLKVKEEALTDYKETTDKTISNLEDQLEQANKRIDDYSRQLEQQQSLQLATVTTNKELQHKLDTLEEAQKDDKHRKGFFSRLFSGN